MRDREEQLDMNVLYVDLDNLLHGRVLRFRAPPTLRPATPDQRLFENIPILVRLLEPYPDLKIVLSTSWVRELGFSRAREFLPASLLQRVIGSTFHDRYIRRHEFAQLTRYNQIVADVERRRPARWLAIDDDLEGWPEHALMHIVPMPLGLGLAAPAPALELEHRLEKVFGYVEKFLIHPDLAKNATVEWPPDDVDLDK
jgi:HAD domain in Swiss Army Knife RNA repair proteins